MPVKKTRTAMLTGGLGFLLRFVSVNNRPPT
jgi:hypothetical protein